MMLVSGRPGRRDHHGNRKGEESGSVSRRWPMCPELPAQSREPEGLAVPVPSTGEAKILVVFGVQVRRTKKV